MEKGKLKDFSKKIGLVGTAILWCLAERGTAVLINMLGARRSGYHKSLIKESDLKTVEDCYEILNNLNKSTVRTIIWRLEKKGLIKKSGKKSALTSSGLSLYEIIKNKKQREKSWDGKFRIVMFDVPETRKSQREFLRHALYSQEYASLQKSVFIGKQPLDKDFIERLIDKDLYQYLRMIVVGDIDDDSILENFV